MVGYITKPAREINKTLLVEFLPELDSKYAVFPTKHEQWSSPGERGPKGKPCFIQHDGTASATPIKTYYVYCMSGHAGKGYYSLMCHVSYINLHKKLRAVPPREPVWPIHALPARTSKVPLIGMRIASGSYS
mmetsp:Transcript_24800/g.58195  ORF Transcript_24800/g.58195 Transcript_24800/m.58195 type:complete len:132 (-) Transcript_24800:351-746(-)